MLIMMMFMPMVMVLMMMCFFLHFLKKSFFQVFFLPNDFEEFLSGKLFNGGRNQIGLRIQSANNPNGFFHFFLRRNIRSGQNNAGCIANLIIKELSKVLVIEFCLGRIHNGYRPIQVHGKICRYGLYCRKNIGELPHSGRLNKDSVRLIGLNYLL